ncbi:hypothetical protein CALVIDRAFT_543212 [Calocera viscosa TUFC12733]|uniref:Uncharacterized protein n=1 Tax=Calocera viscosa (strain TUFC12733) TaxID=1330018 RepID=A0A167FU02_CALVF|nr:hypothetical protein CALVIDRAFT_543212 [Calocera viscosa TUFC12733]
MCSTPRAPLFPLFSPGELVVATGRRVGSTPTSDSVWTCSVHFCSKMGRVFPLSLPVSCVHPL